VLAVAASGFAFSQRAAAVRQRDQASYNQLVAEALQIGASDTPLAAQLNLAAYTIQATQDVASRLLSTENTPLSSPLATKAGPVNSVAFSPDGHTLASGSADGATRLWNLNVQDAIRRICATAGGLTPRQWNEYISSLRDQPLCAH
jgi:WD domain, G-beta repeat